MFSLLRVELYMLCVVEFCDVPVVPRLNLLIMYAWLVPMLCYDRGECVADNPFSEPRLPVPLPGGW